ncbi:hypothetical protein [Flavobacterium restrictum]|uniref:Lipoprotein n=1 Tax=Flavobacterium restrictum TaxID=2594428 RepID=A0A553E2X5_9FLAO|nr:hypothetical protein [Flavobacterium restrictum]TRX39398.1 hypothetical protein FNW21_08880 [Flavobacterium restrictum]
MRKLLFLFATITLLISCNKDDDKSTNPIDQLPPATQTGANTAGCLVDGKAFLPKGTGLGGPVLSCFYYQSQTGYRFGLSINYKTFDFIKSIQFSTNTIQLIENKTYNLTAESKDINNNYYISNFGEYYILTNTGAGDVNYSTTNVATGELKITKLDMQRFIISGTFWYDAVNANNEKVQVREGRFDVHYSN